MEIHQENEENEETEICSFCKTEMCPIGFSDGDYGCPDCGHAIYGFSNVDYDSCEFLEGPSNSVFVIPFQKFKNKKIAREWCNALLKDLEINLPEGHTLKDYRVRQMLQLEILIKGRE